LLRGAQHEADRRRWSGRGGPGTPRCCGARNTERIGAGARNTERIGTGAGAGRKRWHSLLTRPGVEAATIRGGGDVVTVWFTVRLDDRPGSLARVAAALGDRGVNITGIVGVAEDTDGALMLTTSDAAATREAFATLDLAFEEHDPTGGLEPDRLTVADMSRVSPNV
jgi:hypothetical protein